MAEKFPYNSTFAFSENAVIAHRELEGLEKVPVNDEPLFDRAKKVLTLSSAEYPIILKKLVMLVEKSK
ncbi:hypothetical protein HZQ56_09800 [Elizabethkingia anophelis]|uniref:hypothetical protein n=1 Tax=Elizabethkingia anophelis TaxID=1117645 RepID=UPI0021A70C18|nr:hypothetical protein [Elizabethkingia anophelis]MCT3873479.1 hypothetical protein [Elizabethkingia anophelis]